MLAERPLYPIGIVSELLSVHPETIRTWERSDLIHPQRRSDRRYFSDNDIKRLRFILRLMEKGLNIPAISHYLKLYPCWQMNDCPVCMHQSERIGCAKPCWKEEGTYCRASFDEDLCSKCKHRSKEKVQEKVTQAAR